MRPAMAPPASVLWPDEAIDAMAGAAREMLARVGVRVDSERAVAALMAAGCAPGAAGRVLLPAAVIDRALASVPGEFTLLARDPAKSVPVSPAPDATFVHNSGEDPHVADPVTGARGRRRWPTRRWPRASCTGCATRRRSTRCSGPPTCRPSCSPLYSYLALALETDKHLGSPCIDYGWQLDPLSAMAEAVAGAARDRLTYALDVSFSPVSPLQLGAEVCEGLLEAAGRDVVVEILPCPMGGTTAPASLAGGIAQQHAEVLAGVVLAQARPARHTVLRRRAAGAEPPSQRRVPGRRARGRAGFARGHAARPSRRPGLRLLRAHERLAGARAAGRPRRRLSPSC